MSTIPNAPGRWLCRRNPSDGWTPVSVVGDVSGYCVHNPWTGAVDSALSCYQWNGRLSPPSTSPVIRSLETAERLPGRLVVVRVTQAREGTATSRPMQFGDTDTDDTITAVLAHVADIEAELEAQRAECAAQAAEIVTHAAAQARIAELIWLEIPPADILSRISEALAVLSEGLRALPDPQTHPSMGAAIAANLEEQP